MRNNLLTFCICQVTIFIKVIWDIFINVVLQWDRVFYVFVGDWFISKCRQIVLVLVQDVYKWRGFSLSRSRIIVQLCDTVVGRSCLWNPDRNTVCRTYRMLSKIDYRKQSSLASFNTSGSFALKTGIRKQKIILVFVNLIVKVNWCQSCDCDLFVIYLLSALSKQKNTSPCAILQTTHFIYATLTAF